MSKPDEDMTDQELEALTEQVLREHESGEAPFHARPDAAGKFNHPLPAAARASIR